MDNFWYYFKNIESDIIQTLRYVEPDRENFATYSVEYAKIINVACAEIDNLMKTICEKLESIRPESERKPHGNIGQYKECLLNRFPNITEVMLYIPRGKYGIRPFYEWKDSKLSWWDAYQKLKHHKGETLASANLRNALFSVGALLILNLYWIRINSKDQYCLANKDSELFTSEYTQTVAFCSDNRDLPDFL